MWGGLGEDADGHVRPAVPPVVELVACGVRLAGLDEPLGTSLVVFDVVADANDLTKDAGLEARVEANGRR